jgi:hypothetical protein
MKLLIMQFSPTSCHFIPLWSKYSPQHPVFKHPQSTFEIWYKFTEIPEERNAPISSVEESAERTTGNQKTLSRSAAIIVSDRAQNWTHFCCRDLEANRIREIKSNNVRVKAYQL